MKKFLSLVLTLVMVMSLVTVSAGAKDFTDNDTITYDEAVDVVSEIGVVDGYTDGKFNPTNTLTRQAAAKIICNLKLGPTTAAELHADTAPYRDVPANNEFAGYIAYCQKEGIISGYADGSFRPGGTLTGYAFMKMLLGALGYDAGLEGYVGSNWSINVAKQAIHIGLNKGLEGEFNGIKAVNREEACLYAFNTLQADLVEYGQRLTTNINGTEVTLSAGGAKSREWNSQQTRVTSIRDDEIVQFAEEYFSKLVKTPDTDIFMRPAHTWVYDKKIQIGTWVDKDKLLETYTAKVTGRDLYDLLGSATIRDFDLEVYVDGHEAGKSPSGYQNNHYNYKADKEIFVAGDLKRSNTDTLGATGRGVLTEVFIDKDKEIVTVVSIHTWLGQATSSYNESRESATVKVYLTSATGVSKIVNVDDVPEVADVTGDTFYLVRMSDKDTAQLEVVDMEEPEILEDSTITKFSNGQDKSKVQAYPESLTTGGNEYKNSNRAFYDADTLNEYDADLLANNTYNVYLDKYGNFIGIDLFEGAKQYVFVTGYDMRNSNLSVKTAEAAGILLPDGTMDTITVNVKDTNKNIKSMVTDKGNDNAMAYYKPWETNASDGVYLLNRWYTYTKTEAGVYTLKPCVNKDGEAMMLAAKTENRGDDDAQTMKMNCAKLRLDGVSNDEHLLIGETMKYQKAGLTSHRAYGEDESIFITVDVDDVSASFTAAGAATGKITKAITDVNGVWTGVQDVDLITRTSDRVVGDYIVGANLADATDTLASGGDWVADGKGKSYVGENAYAVFDKNNFIIGAVILGEAEGSNATKAYILDPVKYERYENGTYYWQFEAIINGEKVTQEAESHFSDTIDIMRDNQYEIVELRYKGDGDVVVDVKEMDRKDTDPTNHLDKIYGYPFAEVITGGHKVADNETVYDVVLTGADYVDAVTTTNAANLDQDKTDNGQVQFQYVTRPRVNALEHAKAGKVFTETKLGTLNLQGRTLYVRNNQEDYGIDFVRDAKAVVIQPEGPLGDEDMETRTYSSVAEAIDSLGDAVPTTANDDKEFRGIITAVLNSQGVAEWIVFYSDTRVENRNNTNIGQATMTVQVKYKLKGTDNSEASDYGPVQVVRDPVDGLAHVYNPDILSGTKVIPGYHCTLDVKKLLWDKDAKDRVVIFEYEQDAAPDGLVAAEQTAKTVTEMPGQDTEIASKGDAESAIQDAINALLAGTGITAAVEDATEGAAFDPAVNGAAKGDDGHNGSVKVKITLTEGEGDSARTKVIDNYTVALKALPYSADAVAADEAALKAAVAALDAATGTALELAAKVDADKYTAYDTGEKQAKADVEAKIATIIDNSDITVATKVGGVGFTAATNAAEAADRVDGKVGVLITLTLNGSTAETGAAFILKAGATA